MKKKSRLRIASTKINEKPYFVIEGDSDVLNNNKVQRLLRRYRSYFLFDNGYILKATLNYNHLLELIDNINKTLSRIDENPLDLDPDIVNFIRINKYEITEHKVAGSTIKSFDERWRKEIDDFLSIVNNEISRSLLPVQVQSSFYLATMKRAANFSVPGSGKTAMMYGAFAYLSSKDIDEVNKMIVVCPLNAFEAWRSEFVEVFGDKRKLNLMNLRDERYNDYGNIRLDWGASNIIVINYESLQPRLKVLNELIGDKTVVVFDEVHRVKGIGKSRAKAALNLGKSARYHYVLTGTPIPNTYQDIYNFLHLLYDDEYDTYFGWDPKDLENPNPDTINKKLHPFFWRTNKDDLNVPKAEPDNVIVVEPNDQQKQLLKVIYNNESNVLSLYLRLLQASTNPALLLQKIDFYELGFLEDEVDYSFIEALNKVEEEKARLKAYQALDVENMDSEKFNKGIELVMELVNKDKKVIVWGMFVKTMLKIVSVLEKQGVKVNIVYGATPKEERVNLINEFRDGDVEVMVSNPHTLGEAISLHQSVHDAVYFEYNFNLTFMLQSRDRIHRLGLDDTQYTRYYYLMTKGSKANEGFIDDYVYRRLKEKEEVMLTAVDGEYLVPEVTDDYIEEIKRILKINNKNNDQNKKTD